MVTLAIFLPSLAGGGAERAMVNLAIRFAEQGIAVDLVLLTRSGPYLSQVPPQVRIVDFGGQKLLLSLPQLWRYLRQERPEVMMTTLDEPSIAALWVSRVAWVPTRMIVNVQNNISQDARHATQLKVRFMPQLVRWFFPWAERVVPVSHGVAADLEAIGLQRDQICVIHNPIVTPELLQKSTESIEHPWFGSSPAVPIIVAVGRLTRQKDFATLIRAFAQVRQVMPARLLILGEGDDRAALELLIAQLGLTADVSLPGFVDNPFAYVARSSLFVLSSLFEGLPTVLIEAMAVGTPVVATDCPSGPMEILQAGQYGPLVPMGDPTALAQAMLQTLANPHPRSMLQARASEYSIEKSVQQYTDLFDFAVA